MSALPPITDVGRHIQVSILAVRYSTRPNNATDASAVERGVSSGHSSRSRIEDSSRNRIRNRDNGSRSYSMGNIHNAGTHTRNRSGSSPRGQCRC
jgi:hypothetical protein